MKAKKKNILVEFNVRVGEHEHRDFYLFNKKMSNWGYCKEFWGINKRDSSCLKDNMFWDNNMMNAISVYHEQEITKEQADTLKELGVCF
jgi:hypothetical protein|tara:strand:+ start:272 stop:538 length:267 start_codon:yes stop_codon:yes gene_type:complete